MKSHSLAITFALGFLLGAVVEYYNVGYSLLSAQLDYERCVKDGAPQDKCIHRYFLTDIPQ